jgi:hypothetical protein
VGSESSSSPVFVLSSSVDSDKAPVADGWLVRLAVLQQTLPPPRYATVVGCASWCLSHQNRSTRALPHYATEWVAPFGLGGGEKPSSPLPEESQNLPGKSRFNHANQFRARNSAGSLFVLYEAALQDQRHYLVQYEVAVGLVGLHQMSVFTRSVALVPNLPCVRNMYSTH